MMRALPCRNVGRRPLIETKKLCRRRCSAIVSASAVQIPDTYTKVAPKGDHVFVKCAPEEVQTLGGILLPGSATRRPTSGVVVELGDGRVGKKEAHTFSLKKGDSVIYSKFGFAFTELEMGKDQYLLIREDEVIGVMPTANPTADDVPMMQPVNDHVLIKIDEMRDVTSGGVMLPETVKEKPLSGTVIRRGRGKLDEDGNLQKPKIQEGDKVLYFKYAGEKMETTTGEEYVVLRENDILCKA